MPGRSSKHRLLHYLYGSLTEPDAHRQFVRQLTAAFKSSLVAVQRDAREHKHHPLLHFDSEGNPFEAITKAAAAAPFVNPWFAASAAIKLVRHGTGHDEGLLTPAQLQRTDFYHHVLRPFDVFHSFGILVSVEPEGLNVLSLSRSRSAGHYTERECRLADSLLPHIRNVHALQKQLNASTVLEAASLPHALWLLDRTGAVVFHNEAAERLALRADSGISMAKGRLAAMSSRDRADLAAAIAATNQGTASASPLVVHDQRGSPWAVVEARPVAPHVFQSWLISRPVVTVVSARLLAPSRAHLEGLLVRLYGLTQAEARAAVALHACETIAAAARQLSRHEETLRSQLKAVFAKTEANSQARLLRLLDRLCDS
ncbi:helix-turn-helix transcriptional regulator [Pseudoxanthomonas composti]|uniref:HTH luxR-type domain-containing protein n=1 Tax=Pseudoxanthomonas composti TaxID=2137479 RepID=A0A4Q1K008_9GAMM|nr:hypothetical protein [Pseudoxanthomonas composti]RXR08757.1 hypothetical protein EPA99_02790 [Pseudoxanthomonas composti]